LPTRLGKEEETETREKMLHKNRTMQRAARNVCPRKENELPEQVRSWGAAVNAKRGMPAGGSQWPNSSTKNANKKTEGGEGGGVGPERKKGEPVRPYQPGQHSQGKNGTGAF